jgi:hypothetical protein
MDDLVAFLRAQNRAVLGTEEPTPKEFGRWFDQRFGLWLPVDALRALKRRAA